MLDDLNQRLDDVIDTERQGIERRLSESRERLARQQARQRGEPPFEASETASATEEEPYDESLHELLERMAARKQSQLDALPPDPAGRIKSLMDYEFMDPTARQKFQELLASLQQQMLQQTFQGMQQAIQSMTPEDLANLRNMLHDLNEMLEERQRGGQPDFERFMHKYGHYFGQDLKNLDELLDYLARQMAAMQSLLDSMTPEMRQQLQDALDAALQDPGIREELAQLAYNLGQLMPDNPYAQSYQFRGGEELTLSQAMRLMEHLREMQELEAQLGGVRD